MYIKLHLSVLKKINEFECLKNLHRKKAIYIFAALITDRIIPKTMKKGIHPENYRYVIFRDLSNGYAFLTRSTANSKETEKWEDGNEYPVIKLEISNTSHPFYTGKMKLVDTAGRIDKFNSRYKKK